MMKKIKMPNKAWFHRAAEMVLRHLMASIICFVLINAYLFHVSIFQYVILEGVIITTDRVFRNNLLKSLAERHGG